MTVKEIIDGLKFTVDMFLFDPTTGETYKEPRNDMDKTTIDACNGAIELLEQTRWIPCSERLPEEDGQYLISTCMNCIDTCFFYKDDDGYLWVDYEESVIAWMPLPSSYQGESPTDSDKE
jgi:hypothetical protein